VTHDLLPELLPDRADTDLVSLTRSGDTRAFAELWNRHHAAGRSFARTLCRYDADDVVSESFARIFRTIRSGGGPQSGFRPYLFTSIRNLVAEWARRDRESTTLDPELLEDERFSESSLLAKVDQELTVRAFRTLPERWQSALWLTEVEGASNVRLAELFGITPNAVAQLTKRAREGLRDAWIQEHLASAEAGSEHRWVIDRLAARARRRLPRRDLRRVDAHLASCARCALVASEAEQTASRLRVVLIPLLLAGAGAGAYSGLDREGSAVAAEPTKRAPSVWSSRRAAGRFGGVAAMGVAGLLLTSGAITTPAPLLPSPAAAPEVPGTAPRSAEATPSPSPQAALPLPVETGAPPENPADAFGDTAVATSPTPDGPEEATDTLPAAPIEPPAPPASATYAVTAQVAMPSQGSGVAVDPARGLVYVAARSAGAVFVYDESTLALVRTVTVPNEPYGIAIGPTGYVYVSQYTGNNLPGTVSVIAPDATTVAATVPTGLSPVGVSLSRDAILLYVANYFSPFLSVFDLSDPAAPGAIAPIPLQHSAETVTQSADATTLFVASPLSNSVEVVDARTGAHRATWTGLASPHQVTLSADGSTALVTQQLGTAAALFSVPANTVIGEVGLPNSYYQSEDAALGLRFVSQPFTAGGSLAVVGDDGTVRQTLTGITGAYYTATDPITGVTFVSSLSTRTLTRIGVAAE